MKVKSYKDRYGYTRVDCPFCGEFAYLASGHAIDELRNLKRHITNAAKNEALAFLVGTLSPKKTPHLDYYKEHTSFRKVTLADKRTFDNDLKV